MVVVQRLIYYWWLYCWWINDSIQPIYSLLGVSSLLPIQRRQQRRIVGRSKSSDGALSTIWPRPGQHHQHDAAVTRHTSSVLASSITSSGSSSSGTALEPPAITMDHLSCTHDGGEHWQLQDVSYVLPRGASTYMTHTQTHTVYRNDVPCVYSSISPLRRLRVDVVADTLCPCAVAFRQKWR
jgi:hypothetical protein